MYLLKLFLFSSRKKNLKLLTSPQPFFTSPCGVGTAMRCPLYGAAGGIGKGLLSLFCMFTRYKCS